MKKLFLTLSLATAGTAQAASLEPIVVTPNDLDQPLEQVTDTTYVITRQEIDAYGWNTLVDALEHLPAISFVRNGGLGTTTNLYMRGQGGNALLVMIDGVQIADPSNTSLSPLFENLMLDDVERIEVTMGPQSGIWGNNASAGVINIITRGGNKNRFSIMGGSENTRSMHAKVHVGDDRLGFSAAVGTIGTDGFTAIKPYGTSGSGHERDGFTQTDMSFNVHFSPATHHRFEAGYRKTDADLEYDTTYPSYDPDDAFSTTQMRMSLKHLRYQYANGSVLARLQLSENETERDYYGTYTGLLTTAEGKIAWKYWKENRINLSGGTQKVKGNNPGPYGFNASYWHDFYGLTHAHRIGPVRLVEAIRQDNFNAFKDKTTGKIGFKTPLVAGMHLSANYGTAYNAPSAYQIANISPSKQTGELKPESTEGWDATLSLFGLDITRFDSRTRHLIRYDLAGYTGYYNLTGTAHFDGWTVSYQRRFSPFSIQLNGTIQEARDDQGKQLIRVPKQMANATLDWFGLPRTHVALTLHYVGDTYDKAGSGQINLGRYATVDMVINHALNQHFTLFAKAINLLDRDYYLAVDQQNPPQYGYNTGGFQWRIGLRGKF
ncbi:TonB-dependent siderophore receptor [Sulfurivirga sp.]|uniref:TonB-dependent receptor plug domain-containing protein n=1 Tax=Sulfurivirga sp. TaxID=2614236 RepID=UPI0025D1D82C|nr:TonB-dependent receptor [Sulfurivirga sp.]